MHPAAQAGPYLNIQGAPYRPDAFLPQDMGVDHGGGHVLVAEQLLYSADVGAVHEQMSKTYLHRKRIALKA